VCVAGRAGVLVDARAAGRQGQEFLRSSRFLESQLTWLLFPGRAVGLQGQIVAACSSKDLNVHHVVAHRKCSKSGPIAPELVRVYSVWDIVCDQELFKKGLCRVSIPAGLKEDAEHRAGFVDRSLQPGVPATNLDAHLIHEPPRTPPGFSVAELFGEKRRELDLPLAEGFVTDDNATHVQSFLDIALA